MGSADVGNGGEELLLRKVHELSGFPAVVRGGNVGTGLIGMLVVSPGHNTVQGIAKRDREDPLGGCAVHNGRIGDGPRVAAISGVEDARCWPSGREPNVAWA